MMKFRIGTASLQSIIRVTGSQESSRDGIGLFHAENKDLFADLHVVYIKRASGNDVLPYRLRLTLVLQ